MEGANFTVRQAAAATSASLLSLSQSPPPESKLPVKKPTTAIADKPILSVDEMMSLLTSQMVKAPTREVRVGIFEVYFALFKGMGIKFMENNYTAISNNIVELSGHPKLNISWNDVVMMREGCGFLLRSIGKMISEGGQSNALKELTSGWLKRGATIDTGVNKNILTCALNEVSGLLIDLGSAASSHQDLMLETLLSLLNHPAESVNISLSWSLRCLCFALPGHLQKLISKLISNMQKDANVLASDKPEQIKRFSYHGNALASLITVIPHRAMFASFETSAKVFGLATQLIKASTASASKDYRVLTVQAQIAWTLIASLMNLGPHFVRVHLSQLLLFWKNVFAKTTGKDSTAYRSEQEVVYQLTLRENALSALHSFLLYNSKDLLSSDVAKRIVVSLSNVCAYISTPSTVLPPNPTNPGGSSSSSQQKSGPITFLDRENMVRKRLFDCFILIPTKYYETLFSVLLKATMESFSTDPEKVPDHRGALASQVGEKGNTTIDFWGVTSLVKGMNANVSSYIQAEDRGIGRVMVRDIEVQVLEELVQFICSLKIICILLTTTFMLV